MEFLLWFCIGMIVYAWLGYPVILWIVSCLKKKDVQEAEITPTVSLIITAHNEEKVIRGKIENTLELNYPKDKLEIIIASDGSTDKTNEIVAGYAKQGIKLYAQKERRGKSMTQNEAVKLVSPDILVFTDADTTFDTQFLKKLVRPFADPSVGCVSGQLFLKKNDSSISESQGFYWKYETALRAMESEVGILSTSSGGCMAIRRKLFKPLDGQYGEDCIVPLDVILQGYKVVHESEAIAYDIFPSSIDGELKTRIRMTIRNWTGTFSRKQLLNPFKYPLISFSLTSHKLLRWLTSYFLLSIFILNLLLIGGHWYLFLFTLQVIFYVAAFIGFLIERKAKHLRTFTVPFSFCLSNAGMFIGVLKSFLGSKITKYQEDK